MGWLSPAQAFDEPPLGGNEIIAEYVNLARLPLPRLIQLLDEQTQSFLSLVLVHISPCCQKGPVVWRAPYAYHSTQAMEGFSGKRPLGGRIIGRPINNRLTRVTHSGDSNR